ncbi:MAG: hypothetical protein FH750_09900 [Pseudomonas stutzeri]|uniref:hypothetical protein n=1 Tax=Stutzerimonas stutzeri TaxID=316 RepID=UPI001112B48A|nr:hypothetical protein [Stutzerimonas stutzeri]MBU0563308.1 hypothetical protein [Gammaproteobacteria bacterium]MBU0792243.1 hypothetical protein [Gammaproteobacteria bacterium]MBU1805252.1 hypothetical protein [Gammaproteobacteria bacterium]MDH1556870.1 hypothetical protein [Stutzerimonas stutzeri]MTI91663.1 hypothetical protein [Stutzerimonas stutzeri]
MSKAHPVGSSLQASYLLARQEKKFTMDMPEELHAKLKQIAAFSRKSAKDLMIEALTEYTIPKYSKPVE